MKRSLLVFLAIAASALVVKPGVAVSQDRGSESCISADRCLARIAVGGGLKIPLYASYPFDRASGHIRRAVIVVHGRSRNADRYFARMVRSAELENVLGETLIIAPLFSIASDTTSRKPGELYWRRGSDWKNGHRSARILGRRISSFEIIDRLRARLLLQGNFPNLAKLTIIGFSGGGQFVQRYAVGSSDDQGLLTRFVVGSPSSFMYFDPFRPARSGSGFEQRVGTTDCPVNRYKYGPKRLNSYLKRRPLADMVKRYRYRDVVYLVGADDDDPNHESLDKRCPALAQGANRLERTRNFKAYMDRFHAPNNHRLVVVPEVGHSSAKIFRSKAGRKAIFGW